MVETVRGPVDAGALGVTLPHEHIFILRPEALQNVGHVWDSAGYWDEEVHVTDAIEKLTVARAGGIERSSIPPCSASGAASRASSGSTPQSTSTSSSPAASTPSSS